MRYEDLFRKSKKATDLEDGQPRRHLDYEPVAITVFKRRILSALSDRLYDVYHATKSAKELWNLLQGEYGIDDAGIERFNASTFNKFVMVEGKAISDQIHEFQDNLRAVEENGSKFSEDYKVSCLIDKLPPSWSDFAKGECLLLIPMVIVLLCVMLRKGFTLNEPEADIFARLMRLGCLSCLKCEVFHNTNQPLQPLDDSRTLEFSHQPATGTENGHNNRDLSALQLDGECQERAFAAAPAANACAEDSRIILLLMMMLSANAGSECFPCTGSESRSLLPSSSAADEKSLLSSSSAADEQSLLPSSSAADEKSLLPSSSAADEQSLLSSSSAADRLI
ncbi:hypothetical protein RJ640_005935 [Escallonia rubra]|uniref:Uncharacterized protein n=1 Tax=Escallonia rubra TaxID=112253 RepID=A0AA88UFY5_9ASTE|nr:hypothetical protein RJ640_005935 [Escallonia rubra]